MSANVVLSGRDPDLSALVQRTLETTLAPLLSFLPPEARAAAAPDVIWIQLDGAAESPRHDGARKIDWSLLGASWARLETSTPGSPALDSFIGDMLLPRVQVLGALLDLPQSPRGVEFHASLRVRNLARSVAFYAWLLDTWPREWTHRYATFVKPELALNFVLLVADGKELHQDTLYHVGVAVATRDDVIATYHRANDCGITIKKPPRTTWRGTPLHELWLEDPDGTLVEVYARLTAQELSAMPEDQEPWYLVAGTEA